MAVAVSDTPTDAAPCAAAAVRLTPRAHHDEPYDLSLGIRCTASALGNSCNVPEHNDRSPPMTTHRYCSASGSASSTPTSDLLGSNTPAAPAPIGNRASQTKRSLASLDLLL